MAIALFRRALEIHTRLYGNENNKIANDMSALAEALIYFNDDDDDEEVLRLLEQSNSIYTRIFGTSSASVAICKKNLGTLYDRRAQRAQAANDLDSAHTNLQLSLISFSSGARIFMTTNRIDEADVMTRKAASVEEQLRRVEILRAAREVKTAATTKG